MTELDSVWFKMLDTAADAADESGRSAVSEYLRLKASNDTIRAAGTAWLHDTLLQVASPQMRDLSSLSIERVEPHIFSWGNSTMIGTRLEMRQGVRCMAAETGWARRPGDGIMRGGALAFCRISHFGIAEADEEFRLIRADPLPEWLADDGSIVDSERLSGHFNVFLGR